MSELSRAVVTGEGRGFLVNGRARRIVLSSCPNRTMLSLDHVFGTLRRRNPVVVTDEATRAPAL